MHPALYHVGNKTEYGMEQITGLLRDIVESSPAFY
jgi:hypothetical protein